MTSNYAVASKGRGPAGSAGWSPLVPFRVRPCSKRRPVHGEPAVQPNAAAGPSSPATASATGRRSSPRPWRDRELDGREPEFEMRQLARLIGLARCRVWPEMAGRRSLTRGRGIQTECSDPIRTATTIASIVGATSNGSRIYGSKRQPATHERRACRVATDHRAAPIAPWSFEISIDLAITLIGTPSARCNRRIQMQSSAANTPYLLPRCRGKGSQKGQLSAAAWEVSFHVPSTWATSAGRCPSCMLSSLDIPIRGGTQSSKSGR